MTDKRYTPVCRYCKSPEISVDAYATWNNDTQEWELENTFDETSCGECGEMGRRPEWIEEKKP